MGGVRRKFAALPRAPFARDGSLSSHGRLGIYLDADYRIVDTRDGQQVAVHPADFALVRLFLLEVGAHFDSLVLVGRADRQGELGEYISMPPTVEFVELPYYRTLTQLGAVAAATGGTTRQMWRALEQLDAIWVFGPHPFSLMLVALAKLRRKEVVLGVRQDTPAYFRARLPSRMWAPAMAGVHALDASYRLLSRTFKTVVVGPAIARRYGGPRPKLLPLISDSVVPAGDISDGTGSRDWSGPLELLTVGRIDPEKNPLLLVEALADLERQEPGRYRLVWVGDGPLADEVTERAAALGISDRLQLLGWVPFGPELLALYRRAHMFVHVSFTEGVPRVITEALAFAAPIVATDVGGVRDALDDGNAGLLVPVDDREALVAAIRTLADDAELRERLVHRGLELARERTLEAQAALVADFIRGGRGDAGVAPEPE
jgi:glycosyltransferase involved in cell wall biosynthesis